MNIILNNVESEISKFTKKELAKLIRLAVNENSRRKPKVATRYKKSEIDALLDEVGAQIPEMDDIQSIRLSQLSFVGTIERWERNIDLMGLEK